jgi:tetratricopeptide (TPR) repeat protein
MTIRILIPLALFLGLCSCQKHVDYVQSYYYNQKYKYFLNKKEFEKAQTAEFLSKENLQDHYELDSNLGVIFNLLSKNEESEKSFDEALKIIPQQFKNEEDRKQALFNIYFNRGVFFHSQQKVDQALKDYQAALDLNPTSKETTINIELLIQKQKEDEKKKDGKDGKDGKDKQEGQGQDQKPQDKEGDKKEDDKKGQDKEQQKKEDQGKDRKQNSKYQPRPFKGDQLSEGDVKKILGELSQQDKKIRAQFDKKEKNESGVEGKNEKDW